MISPILTVMSTPILSSRFFKDHKPTSALYQKWRGTYSWSNHCLPIYEWDGVLFVGCLQTPTDFPEKIPGTKVVFVLCEPEALKTCWHDFEGTLAFTAPPPKPGLLVEFEDKSEVIAKSDIDNEGTRIPGHTPAAILQPIATPAPEQFSINDEDHSVPEFNVNLADEKLTSPQIKASEKEYAADRDSDLSINIDQLKKESEAEIKAEQAAADPVPAETPPPAVASTQDDDPSSILISEPPAESASENSEAPLEIPTTPGANESAPDGLIFNSKIEAPKFDAEVIKTMTSIKIDRTEAETEPKAEPKTESRPHTVTTGIYTKPGALSSNRELAEKQENTRTGISTVSGIHRTANKLADVVNNVFAEMSHHYKKSMILLAENEEARPWKWSEQFRPDGAINSISFATPNPFRIVSRSQKSYHGYVVPNESNDKFFEEWNEAKTPDHLTVAPILIEESLVGFLIGFGDKSADNKNSLMLCEKLANDVSIQIKRDPLLLKAA
jgi:hypothetical protein